MQQQRDLQHLHLLCCHGGHPWLCWQCHTDRHQLPEHHDTGKEQRAPSPPSPPPRPRRLPVSSATSLFSSPSSPHGAIWYQWIVSLHLLCLNQFLLVLRKHYWCVGWICLSPPFSCVFEYNDPNDYFDVSNHEVDRQEDLEYEVRTSRHITMNKCLSARLGSSHICSSTCRCQVVTPSIVQNFNRWVI